MGELATAIVAGGCFWCTEAVFQGLIGVSAAESGLYRRNHARSDLQGGVQRGDRPCRSDPHHL